MLTVVIPTRNRPTLLPLAIDSVLASAWIEADRVIVVNTGDDEETQTVLARYPVTVLQAAGAIPGAARNVGLAAVETPYVAFLDDDDCWLEGNPGPQLAALDARPRAGYAYGRARFTSPGLEPFGEPFPAGQLPSGDIRRFLLSNHLQLGTAVFRTAAIRAVGGFDATMRYGQDTDLFLRLAARAPAIGVDTIASYFRQRAANRGDAEARWVSHRCHVAMERKLRREGDSLPLRETWRPGLRVRGQTTYYFCQDASLAWAESRRRDALRYLTYAARTSPLHAVRLLPKTVATMTLTRVGG